MNDFDSFITSIRESLQLEIEIQRLKKELESLENRTLDKYIKKIDITFTEGISSEEAYNLIFLEDKLLANLMRKAIKSQIQRKDR